MRVSVAMATYNGARHIEAQLQSFSDQIRKPDELVVCDDISSDATVKLVESFAQTCGFEVRIHVNAARLGYARNFEKALSLCTGDVVFLSDQDDVWYPDKISTMICETSENASPLLFANDSELADESLIGTGLSLLGQLRSIGGDERQFVNGCGTLVRRKFLQVALPIPPEVKTGHDQWLHALAYWLGVRTIVPRVLQVYRRHSSNTSQPLTATLKPISWLDDFRLHANADVAAAYLRESEILQAIDDRIQTTQASGAIELDAAAKCRLQRLRNERKALSRRAEVLRKNRWARVWSAFANYARGDYNSFRGWKSLARDLIR